MNEYVRLPVMENSYHSDVIGITHAQLKANYWINKAPQSQLQRMDLAQISAFNQQLLTHNKHMVEPLSLPSQLSKSVLLHKISLISSIPARPRFYTDGKQLTSFHYQKYTDNLNTKNIADQNVVQWGLIVKRSVLRKFPTHDRVLNKGMDADLDRFQESGVFPGERVAILHESSDKQWYLVQNYHYIAWLPKEAVAIGDKKTIAEFVHASAFLVVTGSKATTSYSPENSAVSEIALDMGVRLPLVTFNHVPTQVGGQNPFAAFVVKMPTRTAEGKLQLASALIARNQDVTTSFLPFTSENIIKQSFKFLGERYGWGHDYNSRDCTGFVGEVYKSFGIVMPRNSGQQGKGVYGRNIRFTSTTSPAEKRDVIRSLAVGDLIYIPGHVMMYLGEENGEPYVIHDVKGLAYLNGEGHLYKGTLNGVSVTPLLPLMLTKTTSYIDKIYNIKRITVSSILPSEHQLTEHKPTLQGAKSQ